MATAIDFEALIKEARQKRKHAESGTLVQDGALASAATEEVSMHDNTILPARSRCSLQQKDHCVHNMPRNVYHLDEWLSEADEELLLSFVDNSPSSRWTQLRGRRLQNLGGLPKGKDSGGMVPKPLPKLMMSVSQALVDAGIFDAEATPNHVLINDYQPGQGIEPHRDGPIYAPRVAILSLGSQCRFDFVHNDPQRKPFASLLLPRKGLLIFDGDAYTKYLHSVPPNLYDIVPGDTFHSASPVLLPADTNIVGGQASDDTGLPLRRQRRVSLTFRRVLQVVERKASEN